MKPENSQPEVETKNNVFTEVKPLSKYLAVVLFTAMPFIGGYIGYKYAPDKIVEVEKVVIKEVGKDVEIEKGDLNDIVTTRGADIIEERESDWRGYPSEEFYGYIHDPRSDEEGHLYIDLVEYKNERRLATTSLEVRRDAIVFYSMWTTCNTLYGLEGAGNSLMSLDWVPSDDRGVRPTCLDTFNLDTFTDKAIMDDYPFPYRITVDDSDMVIQIYQPYHP